MSFVECFVVFNCIVDWMEQYFEEIVVVEIWENGKFVWEIFVVDILFVIDYFCYFVGVFCVQEGGISQFDENMVVYYFYELFGVVGQIILWNFLIFMVVWKLVLVFVVGNCVVIKLVEQIFVLILFLFDIIGDLLFVGVVNIVNGFGIEVGVLFVQYKWICKVVFMGEIMIGCFIMQYVLQNFIFVILEFGGKSLNVFFEDVVCFIVDLFYDKVFEGFMMFVFNQGEVCICLLCVFIQCLIYDGFLVDGLECVKKVVQGNLFDFVMMIGVQVLNDQLEKIFSYIDIGKQGGVWLFMGGECVDFGGDFSEGFYVQLIVFEGINDMWIFQEEIFGFVFLVMLFDDFDDVILIVNDIFYGLGVGVWSCSGDIVYWVGCVIEVG